MPPIVINTYKVIFDSCFSTDFTGAKGSERCNGSKKVNYHMELAEL